MLVIVVLVVGVVGLKIILIETNYVYAPTAITRLFVLRKALRTDIRGVNFCRVLYTYVSIYNLCM
jgi:hypothetical protein